MTKRCAIPGCRQAFDDADADGVDLEAVVGHYLDEHADADPFRDIIADVEVRAVCGACEDCFIADVSVGYPGTGARLSVPAYCPACREEGLRAIMASEIDPAGLVHREVTSG